jgi:hypothetical protein
MSKELKSSDYRRFTQGDFQYEKKKSTEPIYFVYPKFVEALKEKEIPVAPDMQDKELTSFITRADQSTVVKKIPTIVRLKFINQEGEGKGEKREYMIWYENWFGKDVNGHKISPVSDLPKGVDKGIETSRTTDDEGHDTYKLEDEYWIYTVPFNPDKLDEILSETNTDADSVQYICMGIRSFSGYSYDEFRNLPFPELEERGRTGKVQKPVVPISSKPTNKK